MSKSSINTASALKHFKVNDPIMFSLLSKALDSDNPINIPKALPKKQYFNSIVKSIVSQQISTKAAKAIYLRVQEYLVMVSPENVLESDFDGLKACGLSTQKTSYIKRGAEMWGEIPYGNFTKMQNEEIITHLTSLPGIGRWTAEMFLIFSMARPDVFSFGDYGLLKSLYQNYNYKKHWHRKIHTTVEYWSPHQTLASLALWHAKDNSPSL